MDKQSGSFADKIKEMESSLVGGDGAVRYAGIIATVAFEVVVLFLTPNGAGAWFAVVCAIVGWKVLNMIQPSMFLFLPAIGWVIYFIVKFILSYIVGIFIAPLWAGKAIGRAIQQRNE